MSQRDARPAVTHLTVLPACLRVAGRHACWEETGCWWVVFKWRPPPHVARESRGVQVWRAGARVWPSQPGGAFSLNRHIVLSRTFSVSALGTLATTEGCSVRSPRWWGCWGLRGVEQNSPGKSLVAGGRVPAARGVPTPPLGSGDCSLSRPARERIRSRTDN